MADTRAIVSTSGSDSAPLVVSYLGHSTVVIELDGVRVLTDPILRRRVGPLVRAAPPLPADAWSDIDLVLLSHSHWDHLDLGSLRLLGGAQCSLGLFARCGLALLGVIHRGLQILQSLGLAAQGVGPRARLARHRRTGGAGHDGVRLALASSGRAHMIQRSQHIALALLAMDVPTTDR